MGNGKGLGDPARWQLTILPMPKRLARAKGLGFCGGFVVGYAEGGLDDHTSPRPAPAFRGGALPGE